MSNVLASIPEVMLTCDGVIVKKEEFNDNQFANAVVSHNIVKGKSLVTIAWIFTRCLAQRLLSGMKMK